MTKVTLRLSIKWATILVELVAQKCNVAPLPRATNFHFAEIK